MKNAPLALMVIPLLAGVVAFVALLGWAVEPQPRPVEPFKRRLNKNTYLVHIPSIHQGLSIQNVLSGV